MNDRPAGLKRNSEMGPPVINFNFNISKAFFFGSGGGNGSHTNEREPVREHDQRVQSSELCASFRHYDLAELRQVHQRGRTTRNRSGYAVPVLATYPS